ncbi:MAG: hypothetical protein M1814_005386 [Vezdaea aestivalis]|nr:MAG: hypothetical protein M1814_005386 [Vezdaea aestivalis]
MDFSLLLATIALPTEILSHILGFYFASLAPIALGTCGFEIRVNTLMSILINIFPDLARETLFKAAQFKLTSLQCPLIWETPFFENFRHLQISTRVYDWDQLQLRALNRTLFQLKKFTQLRSVSLVLESLPTMLVPGRGTAESGDFGLVNIWMWENRGVNAFRWHPAFASLKGKLKEIKEIEVELVTSSNFEGTTPHNPAEDDPGFENWFLNHVQGIEQ